MLVKISNKWAFLVLAVLIMGCGGSKMKIKSQYDPMANFSKFETYDLKPGLEVKVDDERVNNKFVDDRIRKALVSQMARKGYQKPSSGYPDFWVSYHAVLKNKKRSKNLKFTGDIRDWGAPNKGHISQSYYDEGTLHLDIVDPQTSVTLWRGSARVELDMKVSWKEKEKRINKAVKRILKEFPPD